MADSEHSGALEIDFPSSFAKVPERLSEGCNGRILGRQNLNEQIENETKMPASICLKTKIYGRLKTLQKVFISGNTTRQIAFKIELHFGEKNDAQIKVLFVLRSALMTVLQRVPTAKFPVKNSCCQEVLSDVLWRQKPALNRKVFCKSGRSTAFFRFTLYCRTEDLENLVLRTLRGKTVRG